MAHGKRTQSHKTHARMAAKRLTAVLLGGLFLFSLVLPVLADEAAEAESLQICMLEQHSHTELCLDENGELLCTKVEHVHDETCAVPQTTYCGDANHEHTDLCYVEDAYYCNLVAHAHDALCYDEEGSVICPLPEHEHIDECRSETRFFCEKQAHEHTELCYDEEGVLVCETQEHEHAEETCGLKLIDDETATLETEEPGFATEDSPKATPEEEKEPVELTEDKTQNEDEGEPSPIGGSATATVIQPSAATTGIINPAYQSMKHKKYYQHSCHRMYYEEDGAGRSYLRAFLLTDASSSQSWTADPKPDKNDVNTWWTAKTKSNYMVGYCIDWRCASYSEAGTGHAKYTAVRLEDSRFGSNTTQLSALQSIVENAYPFITEKQLDAKLGTAAGTYCDYIAASQFAVWRTTTDGLPMDTIELYNAGYDGGGKDLITTNAKGFTSSVHSKITAIADYLTTHPLVPLQVQSFSQPTKIVEDDGEYTIRITVTLNRAPTADETVSARLHVGDHVGTQITATAKSFTVELSNEEYRYAAQNGARVELKVAGNKTAGYIYNNDIYQDFLTARWEPFSRNLTFTVGSGKETSVTVSKQWGEGTVKQSVDVYLMANNEVYDKAVTLSVANSFFYRWENLPTVNAFGEAITYTVYEPPVSGMYSITTKADSVTEMNKVLKWVKQSGEKIVKGGEYMFHTDQGALAYVWDTRFNTDRSTLTWEAPTFDDPKNTISRAVWIAGSDANVSSNVVSTTWQNAGAKSEGRNIYLNYGARSGYNVIYPHTTSRTMYFSYANSGLYATLTDGTKKYFDYIIEYNSASDLYSGTASTCSSSGREMFTLYRRMEVSETMADTNYVITNYSLSTPNNPLISVSAEKTWSNKADGVHPTACTVWLLQNGTPLRSVTLSKENNWKYVFTALPAKSADNQAVEYTLEEDFVKDYIPSVTKTTDESGNIRLILDNHWTPEEFEAKLAKTDRDDLSLRFENIPFAVWMLAEDGGTGSVIPGTDKLGNRVGTIDTGTVLEVDCSFAVGQVYYLIEESTPFGYSKPEEPVVLSVKRGTEGPYWTLLSGAAELTETAAGVGLILVKNEFGYILPETGGMGTTLIYIIGAVLLIGAAILVFALTRSKRDDEDGETPPPDPRGTGAGKRPEQDENAPPGSRGL